MVVDCVLKSRVFVFFHLCVCVCVFPLVANAGEKALYRGQVFLGCDNHPISFQNMMDATFLSGEYKGQCKFTGEEKEFAGKEASNNLTRENSQQVFTAPGLNAQS